MPRDEHNRPADDPNRPPDDGEPTSDDVGAAQPDASDARPGGAPDDIQPVLADADADGDRESAYMLLQRGQELLARRHHAQAVVVLDRAARLEPGRGSILEPLGRACFMSGQLARAGEVFEELLAVDPSSHYGQYALGRTLVRLGRVEEGRGHLRLAAALAPDNALYRGGLRRLGGPEDEAGSRRRRSPGD